MTSPIHGGYDPDPLSRSRLPSSTESSTSSTNPIPQEDSNLHVDDQTGLLPSDPSLDGQALIVSEEDQSQQLPTLLIQRSLRNLGNFENFV